MKHVGRVIKILTVKSGLKQKEIASLLDISIQHLHNLFGKESVETKYLFQLSEILKVPVEYFLANENEISSREELIDELNKYDLTLGEYIQQSDELAERIGEKRHLLRMIYKDLKSIDAELNRLDHTNTNEVSIKLRQLINTIDKSEGFEGEEARLQKGKEDRAKLREEIMKTRNERLNKYK